jgi:hypothetical protein
VRNRLLIVAALVASLAHVFVLAQSSPAPTPEPPPAPYIPSPPVQPIPYNHRAHDIAWEIECRECHAMPEPGIAAGLPSTATCMRCHVKMRFNAPDVQKLAGYDARNEPIPWKRVAPWFRNIVFGHKTHMAVPSVTCDTCHGNVRAMEVTTRVKDLTMNGCMSCHDEMAASNDCAICHLR